MRVALVAHGLPALDDDALAFLIGPPLETGMAELLLLLGADTALAPSLVDAYRADYRLHMLDRTTLVPGVADVVAGVGAERACVVTSKPAALAIPIVEHLGLAELVAFVEGPSLGMERETKDVTLGRALERLPSIGVMVGDRHHDVDAGRAHGLRTVGVLWGMGDAAELSGADALVSTPPELAAVLS